MDKFTYGSFNLNFHEGDETGFQAVHPEMAPANYGIKPLGSHFVFCIHPTRRSLTFIVEQDDDCKWYSERKPPFISDKFVGWIETRLKLTAINNTTMKCFLFIVSIPHEKGIVEYNTENMLDLLPAGYRVADRKPGRSVTASEILFSWEC